MSTVRTFGGNVAKRRRQRLLVIAAIGATLLVALGITAVALDSMISYFRTPSQIAAGEDVADRRLRLGGLVKVGSVSREGDRVLFAVTDTAADVSVRYAGILPDLFREGQGIVVDGRLHADGTFVADTVLAKHDENYMPAEVVEALKAQGQWKGAAAALGGETAPASAASGNGE